MNFTIYYYKGALNNISYISSILLLSFDKTTKHW